MPPRNFSVPPQIFAGWGGWAAGPGVLRTADAGFARLPRLRGGGLRPYSAPCTNHLPRPLYRPRKKASHKTLDIRSRGVIE